MKSKFFFSQTENLEPPLTFIKVHQWIPQVQSKHQVQAVLIFRLSPRQWPFQLNPSKFRVNLQWTSHP